jgi:cyanate permease
VRLLVLSVLLVTASTQAVFLLGASFFQIGSEMGLGTVGLGVLTAAFFLTASLTSPVLGRWVQRVGWQRAMRINLAVTGTTLLIIAFVARGVWTLAALLVVAAAIYGSANPAANQSLADHTDPDRQATIFGAKHAGIPGSTLLAGLAVPLVVVDHGWRWAFAVAAVLTWLLILLVPRGDFKQLPPRPSAQGRQPGAAMARRHLVALAIGASFATWAAIALGTFLVSAGLDVGLSEEAAGTLQFVGSGFSITVRIVAGWITDRRHGSGYGGVVFLAGLGAAVFLAMPVASNAWFAVLVVLAYSTGWAWAGLMTFTVVNANRGSAASSTAISQAGVFLGAGLGPLLLAGSIEVWSFDGAWVTAGSGLVVAALIVSWVGRQVRSAAWASAG